MSGDRVGQLSLPALLSQALVAFTIECDNEFERQLPHRTSNYGSTAGRGAGPWLVSMAMWWTCMRFVGEDGITVAELTRRARTGTNLPGMLRWKYISVEEEIIAELWATTTTPRGARPGDAQQAG
jgi:hypothetical protein